MKIHLTDTSNNIILNIINYPSITWIFENIHNCSSSINEQIKQIFVAMSVENLIIA